MSYGLKTFSADGKVNFDSDKYKLFYHTTYVAAGGTTPVYELTTVDQEIVVVNLANSSTYSGTYASILECAVDYTLGYPRITTSCLYSNSAETAIHVFLTGKPL